MKRKHINIAALQFCLLLIVASASAAYGQIDLTAREALYFTGAKATQIDLKSDPYVAKGGSMKLKKSEATSCSGEFCDFNIGFIAIRSGDKTAALSTYGLLQVEGGSMTGNTVHFAPSESVKSGVLPLKLKVGVNRVTFTIDPYKKTAESDERNNSFLVIFTVSADSGKP